MKKTRKPTHLTPLNSILIVDSRAILKVFLLEGNHNIQYVSQDPAIARELRQHSLSLNTEL
jgi:hypothetical protein